MKDVTLVVGDYIVEVFLCDDGTPGITVAKTTIEEWESDDIKKDPPMVDIFAEVMDGGGMNVRWV